MQKKITVIAIFLLLFFSQLIAAQEFTEGYRNAKWGMSFEKVKSCSKAINFKTTMMEIFSFAPFLNSCLKTWIELHYMV